MKYTMDVQVTKNIPRLLREIPGPPQRLYGVGEFPDENTHTFLTVVGSRRYSRYGRDACETIIAGLRGYPVVIVSGLALGIDGIAHRAALSARLKTVAVPGSGLDASVLYPRSHVPLAEEILRSGGSLVSEFEPTFQATTWSFPQRNRIMAGLSHATLVIEAGEKSGTLITSRLATEYNRDVGAVPGSIFSAGSHGSHMLIRLGATPITSSADVLEMLGVAEHSSQDARAAHDFSDLSHEERRVLAALSEPRTKEQLLELLQLNARSLNITISKLEIAGIVSERDGVLYVII